MREPGDLLPPAALPRQVRGELVQRGWPGLERELAQSRLRRFFGEAAVHFELGDDRTQASATAFLCAC
jgi:hypothetical protein